MSTLDSLNWNGKYNLPNYQETCYQAAAVNQLASFRIFFFKEILKI